MECEAMLTVQELPENKIPKFYVDRHWCFVDVQRACDNYGLYTLGTKEEYQAMIERVRNTEPTYENLYLIAKDIAAHTVSGENSISNVMFVLENYAVKKYFYMGRCMGSL